jgi:PAS domain S-box-containing protein
MKNQENNSKSAILRERAEESLKKKLSTRNGSTSEIDTQKLFHELEVHQIELEMQNEELILARTAAEEAAEKYTEIFDFSPIGYFVLNKEGVVIELNLSGAEMLGKDRSSLKNSVFSLFVSNDTKSIFNEFLTESCRRNERKSCEIIIKTEKYLPRNIHLLGTVLENCNQCLINAIDITERLQAELILSEKARELNIFNDLLVGREMKMVELKKEINELLKKCGMEPKY